VSDALFRVALPDGPCLARGSVEAGPLELLPASLALILLSSDLKAIARLGPRAMAAMAAASLGVAAGAVLAFVTLGRALGEGSWRVFAALTADGPAQVFAKRCQYLLDNPPENWDGCWTFTEK